MNEDKPINLRDIQKHLQSVCDEKGWSNNSIEQVFLLLNEEIGELAKAIRKKTNFKGEQSEDQAAIGQNLKEELADVLNYVLEIANRFDVDLTEAYQEKFKINETREW